MPQQLKQFVENSKKQKELTYEYPNMEVNYEKSGAETDLASYDGEIEFGKHFLFNSNVSSDESGKNEKVGENGAGVGHTALNMSKQE